MMMKTRFDNTEKWVTACGEVKSINRMETTHLMNILTMFVKYPERVRDMLVEDLEKGTVVWSPSGSASGADVRKESVRNVTSLTNVELITYALTSPLAKAICVELEGRGVDTWMLYVNILEPYKGQVDVTAIHRKTGVVK